MEKMIIQTFQNMFHGKGDRKIYSIRFSNLNEIIINDEKYYSSNWMVFDAMKDFMHYEENI